MTKKKVLIIAYYWPPAGGPGVQRWLKFITYLPEFNVEPVVYVPENPSYPITDESLLQEVPKGITILKQPIKEPYKFASSISKRSAKTISKGIIPEQKKQSLMQKLMLYVRGNFFIPDARKAWVKPSVKFLSDYLAEHQIDTIITTGPPHSLHLIGLQLKTNLYVRWIADFRDPWTTIGYHKQLKLSKASKARHKALEAAVLNAADQVIVTSQVTKAEFQAITATPIEVITNGHDLEIQNDVALDSKFTWSHIGSLLSGRNPDNLWKTLKEIIDADDGFASDFQLNLIGTVSADVLESIYAYNLKPYVNVMGYVSHQKAIAYQNQSQVLLLIEIDSEDTKCIIPGKLFEYMVSSRPILAFGPAGSDVHAILEDTNSGMYFSYTDDIVLKESILEYYLKYKEGHLKSQPKDIQKYSRRALTKHLSEII